MTRNEYIEEIRNELDRKGDSITIEDESKEAYLNDEQGNPHRIEGLFRTHECGQQQIYVWVDASEESIEPRDGWLIDDLPNGDLKIIHDLFCLSFKDKFASLFERAEELKKDMQDAIDVAVMQITDGSADNDIRLNHSIVCDDGFIIQYIGIDPFGDGIVLFNNEYIHHCAVNMRDDCIDLEIILGILTMLNGDAYTVDHH